MFQRKAFLNLARSFTLRKLFIKKNLFFSRDRLHRGSRNLWRGNYLKKGQLNCDTQGVFLSSFQLLKLCLCLFPVVDKVCCLLWLTLTSLRSSSSCGSSSVRGIPSLSSSSCMRKKNVNCLFQLLIEQGKFALLISSYLSLFRFYER